MKKKKLVVFWKSIQYCLYLSWKSSPLYTMLRIFLNILPSFITIILSYIAKYLINFLALNSTTEKQFQSFIFFSILMLILNIISTSIRNIKAYVETMHNNIINFEISKQIVKKSLHVDMEYFDNSEYHDALVLAMQDSNSVAEIVWNIMLAIGAGIASMSVLVILCTENWAYGFLTLFASLPAAIISIRYTKAVYNLDINQINTERKKSYIQSIAISKNYAANLRLYNAESILINQYEGLWKKVFLERQKIIRTRSVFSGIMNCLPQIVVGFVGLHVGNQIFNKVMTIGDYSLYTGLIGQLWANVYNLINAIVSVYDNQLKIQNLKKLDSFTTHILDSGEKILKEVQNIQFVNVCFSYPKNKLQALDYINFSIGPKEKIALVGINGSGKSTIIKLLLRLYEPDSGEILINGINIKNYTLASLRSNFTVYFQGESNYCFTLRDNIIISDFNKSGDNTYIKNYLEKFAPDIYAHAQGELDTYLTRILSKDGIEFSGGQYQKLALARTFYRRHTVLILDEPSASLDSEAEQHLLNQIENDSSNYPTIFTSHRLSNVSLADRIIVIEHGKIIEVGTQKELLRSGKRYKQLFEYQSKKYVDPLM